MLPKPSPERPPGALDEMIARLDDGGLRVRAHKTRPAAGAVEAHRQMEGGDVHERIIFSPG